MFFVLLRSFHCWKSRWNMTIYSTAKATPVITETEAGCGNNTRAVHLNQGSPFTFGQQSDGLCRCNTKPWIKMLSLGAGLVRDVN